MDPGECDGTCLFELPGARYICVSSLTIVVFDILHHTEENVQLLVNHPIRFPSIVYVFVLATTLAILVLASISPDAVSGLLSPGTIVLALQRASTCLLLYLRVHALYPSNRKLQVVFILAILGVMSSSLLITWFSSVITGVFDLCIFIAILCKLVWGSGRVEYGPRWRMWIPFLRTSDTPIRDRIMRETLLYVLMTVLVKIPSSIYFVNSIVKDSEVFNWALPSVYIDAAIVCIISAKIFRDMKLGLPGLSHNQSTVHSRQLGSLHFASP